MVQHKDGHDWIGQGAKNRRVSTEGNGMESQEGTEKERAEQGKVGRGRTEQVGATPSHIGSLDYMVGQGTGLGMVRQSRLA